MPLCGTEMTAHAALDPLPPTSIDTFRARIRPRPSRWSIRYQTLKLPYQVGFSYFGEWWRANEKIREEKERQRTGRRRDPDRVRGPREAQEDREKEKAKIQVAYDAYKEELQSKMAATFVKQHKDEQWFRERYVPEVRDVFRKEVNEMRRAAYTQWEQDFESALFDEFSWKGFPRARAMAPAAL